MAQSRIRSTQHHIVETTIGKECVFVGTLTSDGNIQVNGVFEGDITSSMHVQVNQTGRVRAHLNVASCTIRGSVVGNITATNDVIIESSAKVWGQIDSTTLHIQPGAMFKGTSHGKADLQMIE
jgi:cytoskeletal protein CcmA (bactofilin family)